jgi:hypothetical protein
MGHVHICTRGIGRLQDALGCVRFFLTSGFACDFGGRADAGASSAFASSPVGPAPSPLSACSPTFTKSRCDMAWGKFVIARYGLSVRNCCG